MFTQEEKEVIQDAFNKINAIPSKNIIVDQFGDNKDSCCIIGHLVRLKSVDPNDYSINNCSDNMFHPLRNLSQRYLTQKGGSADTIVHINNFRNQSIGGEILYPQKTPKERCLACLEDMLKTETVEVAEA